MMKKSKSTTTASSAEGTPVLDDRDTTRRDNCDTIIRDNSDTHSTDNRDIINPEDHGLSTPSSHTPPSTSSDSDIEVPRGGLRPLSTEEDDLAADERDYVSDDSDTRDSDDEQSNSGNGRSFLSCCASIFCCGRNAVSSATHYVTGRHRRTVDEQAVYEENCKKENGFNRWSAFSSLPVDTTGYLIDRALIQNSDHAVPVFAFVNLLRSSFATAVNIYFLCSGGDHPTGSRFSMGSNISIGILSLLLFGFSLAEIGVEAEHPNQDTLLLFLGIFINCLWGGIALLQSGELGFHSYNQTSQNTNTQTHYQHDEELGLAEQTSHRPH